MALVEDVVVNDFVQQNGKVENGESLHERERNPDEWIGEGHERPRANRQDGELPQRDREVSCGALLMQLAHLFSGDRAPEVSPQCDGVLGVVVVFHGQ
jgi:hypothetical protein